MPIKFFPLAMSAKPQPGEPDNAHVGKIFIALPDGSAQLYQLKGYAGPPESNGVVNIESAAKKPSTVTIKVQNWLSETQKLNVSVDITEKPSPATSIIAANVVEVAPNGTKEFPIRYDSIYLYYSNLFIF